MTATALPATRVRWAIALLHLTVAFAIFRRGPLERLGSPRSLIAAIPALVLAGVAFRWAAPLAAWPAALEALFVGGAALAGWTFLTMGASFAVLPAQRTIVSHGPYRWIRHPAYAGEAVMILACGLSLPSLRSLAVCVAAIPLIALRIRAEEQLLGTTEDYRRYRDRVRARLIPCLW